jgi:hypothetical protein
MDGLNDIGTVVADPTPSWYSLQPATELQAAPRVYPEPAVNVVEPPSAFPMTTELRAGVMDATEEPVWLAVEPPVDVTGLVVVAPLSS